MTRVKDDELIEYRASGRKMKQDFDYMLKELLTTLSEYAQENNGVITWEEVRQIVLDYVNKHRRDMSTKYLVKLRDELERKLAVRSYLKAKRSAE
jgi:hypothetical protein